MSYEHEYTSMSIRVPKTFREEYNNTRDFWKELGNFFFEMSKYINKKDINQLRIDNPQIFKFIEEMLPE